MVSMGIKFQFILEYRPQENRLTERAKLSVLDKARCLLETADISVRYWTHAIRTAIYLLNRTVNTITDKTPHEIFYHRKSNLKQLKLFGAKSVAINNGNLDSKCSLTLVLSVSLATAMSDKNDRTV